MKVRPKPYVTVTLKGPEDGGDFGPYTPGTKTSGIQEAIDYAHDNCREVYIFGGRGGMHGGVGVPDNVYNLNETLKIPWSQDFTLGGGNYLLNYTKNTGDAVHIDSQMNCRYKLGLIVSNSDGAVVRIKPETPGPDDFVIVTASVFDFSALVSGHPNGTGILIDSSEGPIINSKIFAEETNTVGKGVYVTDSEGSGKDISNIQVHVMYSNQYHGRGACTGLRVGDTGSRKITDNKFETSLHAPRGAYFDETERRYAVPKEFKVPEEAIGADIFAQRNIFTLSFYGERAPGKDIIFEPESRDNTVFAFNLPNGITNKATVPTNRIIPNWPIGFDIPTPHVPASGEYVVNTNPYTVGIIILTPGNVSEWMITDAERIPQKGTNLTLVESSKRAQHRGQSQTVSASQTISAGLAAGQTITLEPGEKIKLNYSKPPTWRWKALRA